MNQGKMWCVVHPTVGLPLILGGVAVVSLIVHASVMTHTTWVAKFFEGGSHSAAVAQASAPAAMIPAAMNVTPGYAMSVTPVSAQMGNGASSFVVTMTPTAAGGKAVVSDSSL